MKKLLIWAIVAFVLGLLVFLGVNQYLGAGIIFIGLILVDLYSDEKKLAKKQIQEKVK